MKVARSVLTLLLALPAVAAAHESSIATYWLAVDPLSPNEATILVRPGSSPVSFSPSRTFRNTTQPSLTCRNGETDTALPYNELRSCDEVFWKVSFQETPKGAAKLSAQKNLYWRTKRWHLFHEWNALPRLDGMNAQLCLKHTPTRCSVMPELHEPPLILAWGFPSVSIRSSASVFRVHSDVGDLFRGNRSWAPTFERVTRRLMTLLGEAFPSHVDVIWIGRENGLNSIAGAAGHEAVLANLAVSDGKMTQDSIEHGLWVVAHELTHLLLKNKSLPVWASESLAEFFAYEALASSFERPSPLERWEKMSRNFPNAAMGLYQAERLAGRGQGHFHGLFYFKGAAFWTELDQRLREKGTSLAQKVNHLKEAWNQGELPVGFVKTVEESLAKDVLRKLVADYLISDLEANVKSNQASGSTQHSFSQE